MIFIALFFMIAQASWTVSSWASGMDAARDSGVSAASSALESGKGVFAKESGSGFEGLKSWGLSVNPDYRQSSNPAEIEEEARQKFRTDETAMLVQKSHQTREMVQIDLDHLELDANGILKNMGDIGLEAERTFEIKTCRTPGEPFNLTCKRQRVLEIKVVPEVKGSQAYCSGAHRAWWPNHTSGSCMGVCGGCASYPVVVSPKKVEVLREEWVGCETEDRSHEEGLCELVDERPGPHNETRMFEGESVTRDYWETTRVYKCGVKAGSQ